MGRKCTHRGRVTIFESPFLIAIADIAAFVGRSPAEVQLELARAGILPIVNNKPVSPLIGYDPYQVEDWLSKSFSGQAMASHGGASSPSGSSGTQPNVFGTLDGWERPEGESELPER